MGYYNTGLYASRRTLDNRYDYARGLEYGREAGKGSWRDAQQALAWSGATEKQKENPNFKNGFNSGFAQSRATLEATKEGA